jgi:hypothetical protein
MITAFLDRGSPLRFAREGKPYILRLIFYALYFTAHILRLIFYGFLIALLADYPELKNICG